MSGRRFHERNGIIGPSGDENSNLHYFKRQPGHPEQSSDEVGTKRPVVGRPCSCLAGTKSLDYYHEYYGPRDLLQYPMYRYRYNWFLPRLMPDVCTFFCWQRKDAYRCASDEELLAQMAHISQQSLEDGDSRRYAISCLTEICSRIRDLSVRIAGYLLIKFFRMLFRSLQVNEAHLEMIRKMRVDSSRPVVIFPLHRSHGDSFFIDLSLFLGGIPVPYIAAGDNLNLSLISAIFKRCGGFFVRRKIDRVPGTRDVVYRAALRSYVTDLLRHDSVLSFYMEAGRSRTGRPVCVPKLGLLSLVLEFAQHEKDVLLVPLVISYEQTPEGVYTQELAGGAKEPERALSLFWNGFKAFMSSRRSFARMDFGQPVSARELLQSRFFDNNNCAADKESEQVSAVARHLLHDCQRLIPVLTTNMLSWLLLYCCQRHLVSREVLAEEWRTMTDAVLGRGHDVGYGDDTEADLSEALTLLSAHVSVTEDTISLVEGEASVFTLAYYSQAVTISLLPECFLAAALYCQFVQTPWRPFSTDELLTTTLQLVEILSREYAVVPPCKNPEDYFAHVLNDFFVTPGHVIRKPIQRKFEEFDSDDETACEQLLVNGDSKLWLERLRAPLISIMDAYWLASVNLENLVQGESPQWNCLTLPSFIDLCVDDCRNCIADESMSNMESAIASLYQNAVSTFVSQGVLTVSESDKVMSLTTPFANKMALADFSFKIDKFANPAPESTELANTQVTGRMQYSLDDCGYDSDEDIFV